MARMTGGEALVRLLQAYGVRNMFGMAGFQLLPMYQGVATNPEIQHYLVHDERNGAFMADGFARVTQQPGVCDATLGPGATNLVTGLAESFGASIPVVAVTGEVNSAIRGRGATQESDQAGIIRPTVKETIPVDRIDRLAELTRRAFRVACNGRPGPVHLNVREDVAHGEHDFPDHAFRPEPHGMVYPGLRIRPDEETIVSVSDLLRRAHRPVILAGGGVHIAGAAAELTAFAEAAGIPVATSISGKGAIPEHHALSLGVAGRFSRVANDYLNQADVLVVVGCKLGEIVTRRWELMPQEVSMIQVDVDPEELGRNYPVTVPVWGDALLTLRDLATALQDDLPALRTRCAEHAQGALGAKTRWLEQAQAQLESSEVPITIPRLLHDVRQVLPDDGILVCDGGFAAHWAAIFWEVRRSQRDLIANRGHASIGYGVPGAIGAGLGAARRRVVSLCGDGGFSMSLGEIETAVRLGTPVVFVVINNGCQGYVKALQHSLYGRYQSADYGPDVDLAAAAAAMGAYAQTVTDPEDLRNALHRAFDRGEPAVVDVRVTTDPARMLPGKDSRTAARS